jgi:hypothetical protein
MILASLQRWKTMKRLGRPLSMALMAHPARPTRPLTPKTSVATARPMWIVIMTNCFVHVSVPS